MKYILLFCGARDGAGPASSPEDVRRTHADVGDWLTRNSSRIGSIHQLQPPDTATGIPMWLVLKRPDRGPASPAIQTQARTQPAAPARPQITSAPQRSGHLAGV
jgi:hypothetical protein